MDDINMDIDLVGANEDTRLSTFLAQKLKYTQEANQQLRTTIESTKCAIQDNEVAGVDESGLIVGGVCKRYHNGKWCFIVDVSSLEASSSYKDFDVSLKFSPIMTPQYTLMIYDNNLKDFVLHANNSTINLSTIGIRVIITFESIQFIQHLFYDFSIILFCTENNSQSTESKGFNLGSFRISADEMINPALEIKNTQLISNQIDDVLSALASAELIRLAIALPMGVLRDYLVIDCMFREMTPLTQDGRKWFVMNANVAHLDGCLLGCQQEVGGINMADLYIRNENHLFCVLHHLHSCIKGVTILPLKCKHKLEKRETESKFQVGEVFDDEIVLSQVYCGSSNRMDGDVKKFAKGLLQQIDSVIDFYRNVAGCREMPLECDVTDEYHAMRNSLTLQEAKTDLLYEALVDQPEYDRQSKCSQ